MIRATAARLGWVAGEAMILGGVVLILCNALESKDVVEGSAKEFDQRSTCE